MKSKPFASCAELPRGAISSKSSRRGGVVIRGMRTPAAALAVHVPDNKKIPSDKTMLTRMSLLTCIELMELAVDRKSTRLNSSHQIISYAVFCLKKKNKVSRHT